MKRLKEAINKRFLFLGLFSTLLFLIFSVLAYFKAFTLIDFNSTIQVQKYIPRSLDVPFSLFSLFGSFEVVTSLLFFYVLGFFIRKKRFYFWIFAFYAGLHFIEIAGKLLIYHPSPPGIFFRYNLGFYFPSSYMHANYSFPSGHMARSVFLGFVLIAGAFFYFKKKAVKTISAFLIFSFLFMMFISRIYLGEHWLSDCLGGLSLGLGMSSLSLVFWKKT